MSRSNPHIEKTQKMKKRLTFSVTVEYDVRCEAKIDKEMLKRNVLWALERERQNGSLSDIEVNANWVEVKL